MTSTRSYCQFSFGLIGFKHEIYNISFLCIRPTNITWHDVTGLFALFFVILYFKKTSLFFSWKLHIVQHCTYLKGWCTFILKWGRLGPYFTLYLFPLFMYIEDLLDCSCLIISRVILSTGARGTELPLYFSIFCLNIYFQ